MRGCYQEQKVRDYKQIGSVELLRTKPDLWSLFLINNLGLTVQHHGLHSRFHRMLGPVGPLSIALNISLASHTVRAIHTIHGGRKRGSARRAAPVTETRLPVGTGRMSYYVYWSFFRAAACRSAGDNHTLEL